MSDDEGMPEGEAPEREAPRAVPQATEESIAERDALLSRLRVIEDQPLESRADALAHVHDELRARLEAGDSPRG